MKSITIGILGTSEITKRSILLPAASLRGIEIIAIASRDERRAKRYADSHSIPNHYASYDELLQSDDINTVYIPLITSIHAEWTINALTCGKNVLVEKPICLTKTEIQRIISASDAGNSHVMEGLMTQFHPWQLKLLDLVTSKTYGSLISVESFAQYILPEDDSSFRRNKKLGGGVFAEEGGPWLQLTQLCFGLQPNEITACSDKETNSLAETSFVVTYDYGSKGYSKLSCSYTKPYRADHVIRFEEAELLVKNYWRPTFGENKLTMVISERNGSKSKIIFPAQSYFANQLIFFRDMVQNRQDFRPHLKKTFERIEAMELTYSVATDTL